MTSVAVFLVSKDDSWKTCKDHILCSIVWSISMNECCSILKHQQFSFQFCLQNSEFCSGQVPVIFALSRNRSSWDLGGGKVS